MIAARRLTSARSSIILSATHAVITDDKVLKALTLIADDFRLSDRNS